MDAPNTSPRILLSTRRSTRFGRVALPARCYEPLWLRIDPPSPVMKFAISSGHSLALRQLWKGEEVGRVSWHFSGGGRNTPVSQSQA